MSHLADLRVRLGLADDARFTLERMSFEQWGKRLVFSGVSGTTSFRLVFDDVRDLRWRTYITAESDNAASSFPATQLVDFSLGRDQHRSPAQLLAEHFGVSLFYGILNIDI